MKLNSLRQTEQQGRRSCCQVPLSSETVDEYRAGGQQRANGGGVAPIMLGGVRPPPSRSSASAFCSSSLPSVLSAVVGFVLVNLILSTTDYYNSSTAFHLSVVADAPSLPELHDARKQIRQSQQQHLLTKKSVAEEKQHQRFSDNVDGSKVVEGAAWPTKQALLRSPSGDAAAVSAATGNLETAAPVTNETGAVPFPSPENRTEEETQHSQQHPETEMPLPDYNEVFDVSSEKGAVPEKHQHLTTDDKTSTKNSKRREAAKPVPVIKNETSAGRLPVRNNSTQGEQRPPGLKQQQHPQQPQKNQPQPKPNSATMRQEMNETRLFQSAQQGAVNRSDSVPKQLSEEDQGPVNQSEEHSTASQPLTNTQPIEQRTTEVA